MVVENMDITLNIVSEAPKRQKKDVNNSSNETKNISSLSKSIPKPQRVKQKNLGSIVAKNKLKVIGKKILEDQKELKSNQNGGKKLVEFVEPTGMKGKTVLAKRKLEKSEKESLSSIFSGKSGSGVGNGRDFGGNSTGGGSRKDLGGLEKSGRDEKSKKSQDFGEKSANKAKNDDFSNSNLQINTSNGEISTKNNSRNTSEGFNGIQDNLKSRKSKDFTKKPSKKNESRDSEHSTLNISTNNGEISTDDEFANHLEGSENNKKSWKTKKSQDFGKKPGKMGKNEDSKRPNHQSTKSSLFGNNPEIPNLGQRLVKPISEPVFTKAKFSDFEIHPFMVSNLEQNLGFETATTVQQKSIAEILSGKDVLIRSQTGSGKTLAYAIPIVESLQKVTPKLTRDSGLKALVIVPTRELALQTYEAFLKLTKPFTWIVPGYLCGGEKRKAEKARLRRGCNILVATPGRLLDHIQHTEALKLTEVECLVLDEADRMLDMGYEKDIAGIVEALNKPKSSYDPLEIFRQNQKKENTKIVFEDAKDEPKEETENKQSAKRQTILLSATLTSAIEHLAGLTMTNPMFIDAAKENSSGDPGLINEDLIVPEKVAQSYVVVPPKLKLITLSAYVVSKCQTSLKHKTLVFMPTQDMVDFYSDIVSLVLTQEDEEENSQPLVDVQFFKLHGNMDHKERTQIFKTFREAKTGVLFTTDVAARGLDLPRVDTVIQYTGPLSPRDYVHRIGRTARGGTSGVAIIILTPPEVEFIRMLESKRIRIKQEDMNSILQNLTRVDSKHYSVEYSATDLQNKFENVILDDKKFHDAACRAYTSWIRFYSSYPRDMRTYFDRRELHLGHYAKSFGLRDPPKRIGMIGKGLKENQEGRKHDNRLKQVRNDDKIDRKEKKLNDNRGTKTVGMLKRCIMLNTSEYSDGLESVKRGKK